jgi:hypothetical protein
MLSHYIPIVSHSNCHGVAAVAPGSESWPAQSPVLVPVAKHLAPWLWQMLIAAGWTPIKSIVLFVNRTWSLGLRLNLFMKWTKWSKKASKCMEWAVDRLTGKKCLFQDRNMVLCPNICNQNKVWLGQRQSIEAWHAGTFQIKRLVVFMVSTALTDCWSLASYGHAWDIKINRNFSQQPML